MSSYVQGIVDKAEAFEASSPARNKRETEVRSRLIVHGMVIVDCHPLGCCDTVQIVGRAKAQFDEVRDYSD